MEEKVFKRINSQPPYWIFSKTFSVLEREMRLIELDIDTTMNLLDNHSVLYPVWRPEERHGTSSEIGSILPDFKICVPYIMYLLFRSF